ncbi:MAG: pyruvate formate lyase family protein, partial [Eubacteriales bacterium]|nr:pyruvate formate lyase family protein [Eubacteriales bacterium]
DLGLGGMRERAEGRLREEATADQREFLNGAVICYRAVSGYIRRLADQAKAESRLELAEDLNQIAEGKAKTFQQALQLIWIIVLILQKVCGCGVLNFSRMDQYLLTRYQRDLD